jgi:Flp pilus assembly pilin Flp
MLRNFWNDQNGFIVSAELVLIATILVIGMIVGLSELQHSIVQELNDVGDAIGSVNQGYFYSGFQALKSFASPIAVKSYTRGSQFVDQTDDCDNNQCSLTCEPAQSESFK